MRQSAIDLLKRSEWEELVDVRHGDIIACLIDGDLVEGVVRVTPKDLSVSLYGRDIPLLTSSHIMLMAPKIYTVDPWPGSRANDFGILRLKELLVGLYHDYKIILGIKDQIISRIPEFQEEKDRHNAALSELSRRRSSLKKSFKAGSIPQKDYMRELNVIKTGIHEETMLLRKNFQKIFSPMLSDCVHCNNLMQAIENLPL